jgi:glycosyltransferase involved in cell wall biosynthesis
VEAEAGTTGREASSGAVPWLCFAGQDWWYHNRAHSDFQLMTRIARTRDVLLVNSIAMRLPLPGRSTQFLRRIARKAASIARALQTPVPELPRFHVFTPLLVPLYGTPWARRLNGALVAAQVRAACRRVGIARPLCFVTVPTALEAVRRLDCAALVFNRSDKYSEFGETDQSYVRDLEAELLARSDAVLYVSRVLLEEEAASTGARAHFLDHGVDLEHFSRRSAAAEPADLAAIPRPRIGFFGGIDDYVIDFELLEKLARELPHARLVLIGDATCSMRRFERFPNVHWLGYRPYADIPAYGSGFDVAIMPWLENRWIRSSNPIKLKEYLALGLPIVSTRFPEVERYRDVVRVAASADEFVAMVAGVLESGDRGDADARRRRVADSSWDAKAAELLRLGDALAGGSRCAA